MLKFNLNLNALASACAALLLTVVASWTFVDATKIARFSTHSNAAGVAVVSALVR